VQRESGVGRGAAPAARPPSLRLEHPREARARVADAGGAVGGRAQARGAASGLTAWPGEDAGAASPPAIILTRKHRRHGSRAAGVWSRQACAGCLRRAWEVHPAAGRCPDFRDLHAVHAW